MAFPFAEPAGERLTRVRRVADVLHHLQHPQHLRKNEVTHGLFTDADAHNESGTLSFLQRVVDSALSGLPPRQRLIVERCDLRGERHDDVIGDLALSARHFYRERRKALLEIGRCIREARPERAPAATVAVDLLEAAVTRAVRQWECGCVDSGIAQLELIARSVPDMPGKVAAMSALIDCCAFAGGKYRGASLRHAADAERMVRASAEREALRGQIDAAVAVALRLSGDEKSSMVAGARARRSLSAAMRSGTRTTRLGDALVAVGSLAAERYIEEGNVAAARADTEEILRFVCDVQPPGTQGRLRAAYHHANVRLYADLSSERVSAMQRILSDAFALGLTAEAIWAAHSIAGAYRFMRRPADAVHFIHGLLPIFDDIAFGEARGTLAVQLGAAYLALGDRMRAADALQLGRELVPEGSFVSAVASTYQAQVLMAGDDTRAAIRAADRAIAETTKLRRWRFVASNLRTRALILEKMGERTSARVCIGDCIDILGSCGRPELRAAAERDAARMDACEAQGDRGRRPAPRREAAGQLN